MYMTNVKNPLFYYMQVLPILPNKVMAVATANSMVHLKDPVTTRHHKVPSHLKIECILHTVGPKVMGKLSLR